MESDRRILSELRKNCFQFNNSFFEQHEGAAMGNSLSPFIANLFMSRFDTDIKEEFKYFPRIWIRYATPKDIIGVNDRYGIYEISCKDCNLKYVGQTRRSILTRFKEHMAHLKYGRIDKSSVAQHAFDNNHRIDINNLSLVKNVTNNRQLDGFESLEIVKCKNRMNSDNGPIPNSPLYWLVRQGSLNRKHSHGSLNRDHSLGINRVGLILGIAGACRTDELVNLTVDDIEDRLFLYYKAGKCSSQPVGKNTMGKIPSVVASYLKLPDVACYTGHCLRRSSATLLADAGVDITTIKRHAGWKSTTVAEGYVENSIENKTKIANQVLVGAERFSNTVKLFQSSPASIVILLHRT
ncbi:hypothetical protein NQ317_003871 [Molorchus minor]|uniref:GIY-YIG domain-containing protein n=1 Tax=Molorchus minor TaxID=1323400 RepID=A0ABQ9JVV2_9CUCU|nr:hypothetical protein NQ317_003871 [Molorchus minor]